MKKTPLLLALTTLGCNLNATHHASLWAALGLLAALTFGPPPAQAAVTEAWVQRYKSQNAARMLAMDGSGNVVVTGTIIGRDGTWDYYTAKYAAADGALLWEKHGPSGGALAVVADGNRSVVVTGFAEQWPNADYYTAKYAAMSGALLWEQRYSGPADGDDFAFGLALGPNGMVAVTGFSSGDCATLVYWENLPPVSVALVSTGIRLRFTGVLGQSYSIERAPAVTGPWTPINTQTAPASGLLEYIDTTPSLSQAFYRTVQP